MDLCSEYLDKGLNSVWERYNKVELSTALEAWQEFRPDLRKEVMGQGRGWKLINDNTGAHIALLSWNIAQNAKGLDSAYVWEVKDEFIPERYVQKTRLDTEFDDSMSVRKSVIRKYPTRSIYLANCIQWINPYTIGWGFPPVDRGTALRMVEDMSYTTKSGKIISDRKSVIWENIAMTDAMIERTFHSSVAGARSEAELQAYYDNATKQEYSRIGLCPDMSIQLAPLQLMSQDYWMGYRVHDGQMYWSKTKPRSDIETYVSEAAYIDASKKRFRDPSLSPQIEKYFNEGRCIFDSPETLVALQRWLFHNRQRI